MENLVLFVKSYHGHLNYTVQLIETIKQYNKDGIKTYLSVPRDQQQMFRNSVDMDVCELLIDEDIVGKNLNDNWYAQQLVKMMFSQTKLARNYFWIDADSYFIKPFGISDFMYTEDIPYTTIHENKDLFQWMATKGDLLKNVLQSYKNDRDKVRAVFGRTGKYYDWTCPNLWSSKIFDHMKEHYMEPNELTFETLLQYVPGELIWYGEYLLTTQIIPIIPCESWFKPFHYLEQMLDYKRQGHTEETMAMNFLGLVMPSKETNQLRF